MWCRALLVVLALTCTFQREITADTDDLLCVLLLSGLQKDDLDVNLLRKLQRHNINIDDVNNRKTIENCFLRSASERPNGNGSQPTTDIVPTSSYQSQLNNYKLNKTTRVKDLSKQENNTKLDKSELENIIKTNTLRGPNNEKFMNLWITYNKINHLDNGGQITGDFQKYRTAQQPIPLKKEFEIVSQATDLAFFHKMVEGYISFPKDVITMEPTTTKKQLDIVSEQLKKFLKNNNSHHHNKTEVDRVFEATQTESTNTHTPINTYNERMAVKKLASENKNKINPNLTETENKGARQTTQQRPNSFENFINLWITFNKTNHQTDTPIYQTTENAQKTMTTTELFPFAKDTNIDPEATGLDIINKMLSYIVAQKAVTTTERTTTERQTDIVSQQIMKFLKNTNIYLNKTLTLPVSKEATRNGNAYTNNGDDEFIMRKKDSNSYEPFGPNTQSNLSGPSTRIPKNGEQLDSNSKVIAKIKEICEQLPTTSKNEKIIDPQSKYIEMLKAFIASKYEQTSTLPPTTTPTHIDIILQEIKEFLINNGTHNNKVTQHTVHLPNDINGKNLVTRKSLSAQTKNDHSIKNETVFNNSRIVVAKDVKPLPQVPIAFTDDRRAGSHSGEMNHMFKMFERYLATKHTETTRSMPHHVDNVVAQNVKEYLDKGKQMKNNDNVFQKAIIRRAPESNTMSKNDDRLYRYRNELARQAKLLNMAETFELTSKKPVITETKPLSEDMIKELTEKVRASVLKDLQKHIPSTLQSITKQTPKVTTTVATPKLVQGNFKSSTTGFQRYKKETVVKNLTESERPLSNGTSIPQTEQDKIKTATNALENFIEIFDQFKNIKGSLPAPDPKHTLTQKGKTKNEFHGPINVVYPSLLPVNYTNHIQGVSGMPIYVSPYQSLQINNPVLHKTKITNQIRELRYNLPLNDMHLAAAPIIQTDDVQVPLLGIPVPKSVSPINQNIIVSTKNPMIQFKEQYEHKLHTKKKSPNYQAVLSRGHGKYDTDSERQSDTDYGRQSDIDRTRFGRPSELDGTARLSDTYHISKPADRYHISRLTDIDHNSRPSDTEIERYSDTDIRYHTDMERSYGREHKYLPHSRYYKTDFKKNTHQRQLSRDRQANLDIDNFYREYISKVGRKSDEDSRDWDLPLLSQERKKQRFHERLEKPNKWQSHNKQSNPPRQDISTKVVKPINIASRQQLSLDQLKEKKRLQGDSHYINFLKRQKKVNDMLETMLSPKSSETVRSVETPDTIHSK